MSSVWITKNYRETLGAYFKLYQDGKEHRNNQQGPGGNEELISELKNTVEGIKSRLDEAEDQISKLEHKVEKNTQNEQEKEKRSERMKRD